MDRLPLNYKPSLVEAQKYFDVWESLPNYTAHERALAELFRGHNSPFTKNDRLESIIIKASALNDFYSTNISRIYDVAQLILSIHNVDKRLAEGDLSLVDDIRHVSFKRYKRSEDGKVKSQHVSIDNYSFATKFCSHHQPEKFPIFDKYVAQVLSHLKSIYSEVFNFKAKDLRDYSVFTKQLDILRNTFGLQSLSYKELDRYLWQLGKRFFSPYIDAVNGSINYEK